MRYVICVAIFALTAKIAWDKTKPLREFIAVLRGKKKPNRPKDGPAKRLGM